MTAGRGCAPHGAGPGAAQVVGRRVTSAPPQGDLPARRGRLTRRDPLHGPGPPHLDQPTPRGAHPATPDIIGTNSWARVHNHPRGGGAVSCVGSPGFLGSSPATACGPGTVLALAMPRRPASSMPVSSRTSRAMALSLWAFPAPTGPAPFISSVALGLFTL